MKALLCLLGFLAIAGAAHGEWWDELTPAPGTFAPLRPFHAHYRFGWGMLTAADADFDYGRSKPGVARIAVTARSTGMVRGLWRMDAQHVATMDAATLRPLALTQSETYKDESSVTKVQFTPEGASRTRETKPPGKSPGKVKTFKFWPVYDLHSALQFVRSQSLAPGESYKLAVYPTTAPYLAQVTVAGRQKLKAAGSQWNAIKLDLRLWRINKDFELEPHEKFKRMSAWLSDDQDRILLRLDGEIHVGTVWGELDRVEWK